MRACLNCGRVLYLVIWVMVYGPIGYGKLLVMAMYDVGRKAWGGEEWYGMAGLITELAMSR